MSVCCCFFCACGGVVVVVGGGGGGGGGGVVGWGGICMFSACEDYFTHFEPSQSLDGTKT